MNYQANYREKEQRFKKITRMFNKRFNEQRTAKKRIEELKKEKEYLEEED